MNALSCLTCNCLPSFAFSCFIELFFEGLDFGLFFISVFFGVIHMSCVIIMLFRFLQLVDVEQDCFRVDSSIGGLIRVGSGTSQTDELISYYIVYYLFTYNINTCWSIFFLQ